jgi:hypothetical protein
VRLSLDVPSDGHSVRADRVAVSGTVTPADAAVQVAGADADVDGGEFTAEVALLPGGNVIDITATAPGRRPATDALRVLRDMRVEVPSLAGGDSETALAALSELELRAVEERGGSWIDRLLPGEWLVCSTTPPAGTLVEPRSRITLETARTC